MESYTIKNLSFAYPGSEKNALDNINIEIEKGSFVTICGHIGSGKTTLIKHLKPSLAPHGASRGEILFEGKPLKDISGRDECEKIAFIMQNPEVQSVTDKVYHEIAFGLESLGFESREIHTRVAETTAFFGIQDIWNKNIDELSGGQKQIVNLASVMAMRPSVIVLDEPTCRLDPIASTKFIAELERINREIGTTIIITEHNLNEVFALSDKVIVLENGRVICDASPAEAGKILRDKSSSIVKALPTPMRVYGASNSDDICPITIREGRAWLGKQNLIKTQIAKKNKDISDEVSVHLKNVFFRYEKNGRDIIKNLNLKVHKGEILAINGSNGIGKSTLLSLIANVKKQYSGSVVTKGKVALLPQEPKLLFVKKTVFEDLYSIVCGSEEEKMERVEYIANVCKISALLNRHPFDLSGGETQKVALAKLLLTNPDILLLDEPTNSIDALCKEEICALLKSVSANGVTIIMVSHDLDFCAECAHKCTMFFDGGLTTPVNTYEFFSSNSYYTTSANRMAKEILPEAITLSDITSALGGDEDRVSHLEYVVQKQTVLQNEKEINQKNKTKLPGRTVVSVIMSLFAIPLTMFCGIYFLNDEQYNLISLLMVIEALVPFALIFEGRSPKAREVIIISVMCAIAVASRVAFASVPAAKPFLAIVIISGIALGGETGFLVGALSMFVSNMYFGQGAWTPWQMFTYGLMGMLGGLVFNKRPKWQKRIPMSLFGFLVAMIIHGGIMNPASVIMGQGKITRGMILSSYAMGFPIDLVQAISTTIFLWLIAPVMIEKLNRVKNKYGLL